MFHPECSYVIDELELDTVCSFIYIYTSIRILLKTMVNT